jgi:hypothetical protein
LLVVVFALAVGIALPRMASSPAVRSSLADAATSALGYRFAFEELKLQIFPPTAIMDRVEIDQDAGDRVDREADPFARAERIELVLAVTPLLAGAVLVDSALVVGAQLEVVRTGRGFQFPKPTPRESQPNNIYVRDVELRDAAVIIVDRSVVPPLFWRLRDVRAHVFGETLHSPVRVELSGALASGGQLGVRGTWTLAGEIDLELKFDDLAIDTAEPYFEPRSPVEGLLTGSIRATGTLESLSVAVDATCQGARFQLGKVALDGPLEVAARIDDAWAAPHGQIDLDATQAKLTYDDFFAKPPGTAARVTGTLSHDPDGWLTIEAWKFVMKDLDSKGKKNK